MATAEGIFPKTGNDPPFASEYNLLRPVMQVYTGIGFDSSQVNVGTDEQDHELTAVTSTQAKSAGYVKVRITGFADASTATGENSDISLKAQIKETGGAYGDIVAYTIILHAEDSVRTKASCTYELIYELTAGMKTNGFQIKVFSKSVMSGDGSGSFTNIQTVVELT